MMRKSMLTAFLVASALPALADPPGDILDLLGARAPGAENQMQARGYVAVKNNDWWNEKTGVCVRVHVSQGRYQTIDMLSPIDCGMKAAEESDGDAPTEPSRAAMDACMNSADALQEEETGSSVVKHAKRSGKNWVLTMSTLGRASHCTVTQAGEVITMDP
ncbi:hypothetical protein [Mesorhizobium sp. KR9-304]|uniref:hypothetical protein n=1 Tax=Mesorhizobium sp. KR9-304 TaxID=3156614 RepID=UPI0032B35439